uniref:Uncharacterized protein n=1 Tax=Arundo donax TaxID=35708 RepID=A0A0A9EE64_ARUDO
MELRRRCSSSPCCPPRRRGSVPSQEHQARAPPRARTCSFHATGFPGPAPPRRRRHDRTRLRGQPAATPASAPAERSPATTRSPPRACRLPAVLDGGRSPPRRPFARGGDRAPPCSRQRQGSGGATAIRRADAVTDLPHGFLSVSPAAESLLLADGRSPSRRPFPRSSSPAVMAISPFPSSLN